MLMIAYPCLVDTLTLLLISISTESWSISFEVLLKVFLSRLLLAFFLSNEWRKAMKGLTPSEQSVSIQNLAVMGECCCKWVFCCRGCSHIPIRLAKVASKCFVSISLFFWLWKATLINKQHLLKCVCKVLLSSCHFLCGQIFAKNFLRFPSRIPALCWSCP